MKEYSRNMAKSRSGSYVPPDTDDGFTPPKFFIREKIKEMMRYCLPLLDEFPRRQRKIEDVLRENVLELNRLAIRLERRHQKRATLEKMDDALAELKDFVVLASDKDFRGQKYAPPLTMHQREVWARYNDEIGKMIGGYLKSLDKEK
jgi:hypothetical protein